MSSMRHPNVALFMGCGLKAPHVCIVTEYYPKGSLSDVLADMAEVHLSAWEDLTLTLTLIGGTSLACEA